MHLSKKDKQRLIQTYSSKIKAYGIHDPRALYWNSSETQKARFTALCGIDDLTNKSVLDAGCGLGDLSSFLRSQFEIRAYEGFDIVPDMIDGAKEKYPDEIFRCAQITDYLDREDIDYVLASGFFSHKVEDHERKTREIIRSMFEIANKGVAFNMLDYRYHIDNDFFATFDSREILDFCQTLSTNVKFRNDYLYYDFTIYLYK